MRERVYKRRISVVGAQRAEPRAQAVLNKMAEPGAILHLPARSPSSTSQLKTLGSGGSTSFALALAVFKFDIGISAEQLCQIFTSHILQGRDRHFGHLIHS